jgi:CheY-like chemotaxis protein
MSLPHAPRFPVQNIGVSPVPATAPNAPATTPVPAIGRRARVLVIDDDPAILRVIQRALGASHDVTGFCQPQEALAFVAQNPMWDLVLCDIHMPQMEGPEVHRALRAISPRLGNAVVFLSGGSAEPTADGALCPRLEKPFDVRALRDLAGSRVS